MELNSSNTIEDRGSDRSSLTNKKISKSESPLISALFEFFYACFSSKSAKEKKSPLEKVKILITNFLFSIQIISLLYFPEMRIDNWNSNNGIFVLLGYLRIDNSCSALNFIVPCTYLAISLLSFSLLLTLFGLVTIYSGNKLPETVMKIASGCLKFISYYVLIPIIALLSLVVKINQEKPQEIKEYAELNEFSDFEVNAGVVIFIIPLLIFSLLLFLSKAALTGDIKHVSSKHSLVARAHSNISCLTVLYTFLLAALHAAIGLKNTIYFHAIVLLATLVMVIYVVKY